MSWDRVLPKPPALHYDPTGRDLPTRTSTPVDHQIMADKFCKIAVDESNHRLVSLDSRILPAALSRNAIPSPERVTLAEAPPPVLISPIARKRTSSLITSEAARQERSASSSSSKSTSSKESPSKHFCLCQPEPKIPRPRNAFILFRQHFQASVVAQHPGLANPEISKIIGEKWRTLPAESKQDWKNLAEEEKARHQQQYPEYRYQPRRYGRNGSNSTSIGSGISNNPTGASVCNRCGGRVMNPPSTPSTPFTPSDPSPVTSTSSSCQQTQSMQRNFQGKRTRDETGIPHPIHVTGGMSRRVAIRSQMHDEFIPLSPDVKRCRFNGLYGPVGRDMSPEYPYSPRRTSFPRPESLYTRAPYPTGVTPPTRAPRQQAPVDPSLTLPPLQTMSLPQQKQTNAEAMVMSIPYLNKIKVLSDISLPLMSSQRKGDTVGWGALVAIEGKDRESVKCMVQHLQTVLSKEGNIVVRLFEGPEAEVTLSDAKPEDLGVHLFNKVMIWHGISKEIISFINGTPEPSEQEEPASGISPKCIVPKTAQLRISSPDGSSASAAPTPAPTPTSASASAPAPTPDSATESASPRAASELPFHVALVPRYQLTTADAYACAAPINDLYAPTDHWQWMASLWRICLGPDVTVFIRNCEKEELDKFDGKPVEVQLKDYRTLVVRRVAGLEPKVWEEGLRRVGFELAEFLRQKWPSSFVSS
ncbi:hypothetical protein AJ79_08806 [Helicocarpus griseus UAMH5409]|uniref:HMG box domain-containing protein n=1 Tax=Helicocarpus griseus UAMH5409 TaxID=1447875 RepID=A0A2B7WQ87_9EURO|nr:hypothetical protein AJ79_08806 [Helicocarpus griseus UAMH5409]